MDPSKDEDDSIKKLLNYNFGELSERHPSLRKYITKTKTTVDNELITRYHFKFSIEGQYELFKVKLLDNFNFVLKDEDYIAGKLIPTIPSRLMYLSIIEQVLKECGMESRIKGLDVGCGTYAIYCVLGELVYDWDMAGIDIDEVSIAQARKIVEQNELGVRLFKNDGLLGIEEEKYSFICCNPPFYNSFEEIENNTRNKVTLRRDQVVGSESELVFANGGEVGFIEKLIGESQKNDISVWYSSLICKKESINKVSEILGTCKNWFFKSFQLGVSKRWIIFWSWKLERPIIYHDKNYKNVIMTIVECKVNLSILEKELKKNQYLELKIEEDKITVVSKHGDVWSRSFRRRKSDGQLLRSDKYVFILSNQDSIYWKHGSSPKIFQSFYTLIKKIMHGV